MADNYLENKMEQHRRGIVPKYYPRKTPTGQQAGSITYKIGVRRVFVTGGASGIGRAIVREFCNAGCRVAFCDTDTKAGTATAQATGARFIPLDVTDPDKLACALTALMDEWGDIDIIVNNVGISDFKPLIDTSVDDFNHVLATNVTPLLVTAQTLARHRMKQSERNSYGRIINIASTRAIQSEADTTAYSASKGAILAMTHSLMMSLAPLHITVNCISPGWIATDDYDFLTEADHAQHPSGRVGKPEDIARICMTLAIPTNDFINGENIIIDGGMTRRMIYC
ncbi:MAG: SDR family oxidoreductase [Candidatus Amulumruptor sp.]